MIDISPGGLIGAIVGTLVAAALYVVVADRAQRLLLKYRGPGQDPDTLRQELAMLRRGVLALDILLFGGAGYWLGDRIGG